ncbi:MAG: YbjN domain-containing protein [Oscillospiraceae bacterium]|nr:YbjN domain-containing protein [Oscillospiraceae bacterium]
MADKAKKRTNVTDSIRDFYESQHWKYRYDPEKGLFRMYMCLRTEDVDACEVRTIVRDEERFTTFVTFPFKVPEKKRGLAADFISRANYRLLLGCFEMDFQDGEIQYKTSCLCGNIRLEPELVEQQVCVGIQMAEQYGEGLVDVLFRGVPPEEAIRKIQEAEED